MREFIRNKKNIFSVIWILVVCVFYSTNVKAGQKSIVDLKDGITYTQYDVTGDKKADQIYIWGKKYDSAFYQEHRVYINGKCLIDIKDGDLGADAKILKFADGTTYLYLVLWEDNGDGIHGIYQYKNGKMIKKAAPTDLLKNMGYHEFLNIEKIKGNTLFLTLGTYTNALGWLKFKVKYKCENNNLKVYGKTYEVKQYARDSKNGSGVKSDRPYLTAARSLQAYKNESGSRKSFLIKKGTKLKALKVHIEKRKITFYLMTKSGKKGWCVSPKKYGNPFVLDAYYAG